MPLPQRQNIPFSSMRFGANTANKDANSSGNASNSSGVTDAASNIASGGSVPRGKQQTFTFEPGDSFYFGGRNDTENSSSSKGWGSSSTSSLAGSKSDSTFANVSHPDNKTSSSSSCSTASEHDTINNNKVPEFNFGIDFVKLAMNFDCDGKENNHTGNQQKPLSFDGSIQSPPRSQIRNRKRNKRLAVTNSSGFTFSANAPDNASDSNSSSNSTTTANDGTITSFSFGTDASSKSSATNDQNSIPFTFGSVPSSSRTDSSKKQGTYDSFKFGAPKTGQSSAPSGSNPFESGFETPTENQNLDGFVGTSAPKTNSNVLETVFSFSSATDMDLGLDGNGDEQASAHQFNPFAPITNTSSKSSSDTTKRATNDTTALCDVANIRYRLRHNFSGWFMPCITAQAEYLNYSLEELRWEVYKNMPKDETSEKSAQFQTSDNNTNANSFGSTTTTTNESKSPDKAQSPETETPPAPKRKRTTYSSFHYPFPMHLRKKYTSSKDSLVAQLEDSPNENEVILRGCKDDVENSLYKLDEALQELTASQVSTLLHAEPSVIRELCTHLSSNSASSRSFHAQFPHCSITAPQSVMHNYNTLNRCVWSMSGPVNIEVHYGSMRDCYVDCVVNFVSTDLERILNNDMSTDLEHEWTQLKETLSETLYYRCEEKGSLDGQAVHTLSSFPNSQYMIHCFPPVLPNDTARELLARCVQSIIEQASLLGVESIAIPCFTQKKWNNRFIPQFLSLKFCDILSCPWKLPRACRLKKIVFIANNMQDVSLFHFHTSQYHVRNSKFEWNPHMLECQWEWRDGDSWEPYPSSVNVEIEAAYNSRKENLKVTILKRLCDHRCQDYLLDFSRMCQVNQSTQYERLIRRQLVSRYASLGADEEEFKEETDEVVLDSIKCTAFDSETLSQVTESVRKMIEKYRTHITLPHLFDESQFEEWALEHGLSYSVDPRTHSVTFYGSKRELSIVEKLFEAIKPKYWPEHWRPMYGSEDVKIIKLHRHQKEYQEISTLFASTSPSQRIVRIERIQNLYLWERFSRKKEQCEKKCGGKSLPVLQLFHGTSETPPNRIYLSENGMDRTFSRAGLWGYGLYAAVNSRYSRKNYAYHVKSRTGNQQLLVVRVLVGNSIEMPENREYRRAPDGYHSVKGHTNGSDVYIVYQNDQVYPEYLITYHD